MGVMHIPKQSRAVLYLSTPNTTIVWINSNTPER